MAHSRKEVLLGICIFTILHIENRK
jgi:hypothetical protein